VAVCLTGCAATDNVCSESALIADRPSERRGA
jgi:hypothetical protein